MENPSGPLIRVRRSKWCIMEYSRYCYGKKESKPWLEWHGWIDNPKISPEERPGPFTLTCPDLDCDGICEIYIEEEKCKRCRGMIIFDTTRLARSQFRCLVCGYSYVQSVTSVNFSVKAPKVKWINHELPVN